MTDKNLLYEIQKAGFGAIEANLYLDAYPKCDDALKYFNEMTHKYDELVNMYEEKCGPLTASSNGEQCWRWTDGPWPWELEAN